MANRRIDIALILSAHNRATAVIDRAVNGAIKKMDALSKKADAIANKAFNTGRDLTVAGLAVGKPVYSTITAFGDLENAQLSLKSTMMNSLGQVPPAFEKINKLAVQLGNELPGNTADFYNMFDVMMRNGAQANDILGGTGRAAAYLAVQLKLPYDVAGEFAQRMQVATGTANKDMLAFMDTLARVKQLGPNVDEMQYAFQRSAGELKAMKIQGLQAMQELSPVYAVLIKTMGSGERVGTNFAALLQSFGDAKAMKNLNLMATAMGMQPFKFVDKKGDFLGINNMMQQFDRMKSLPTIQKNLLIQQLAGARGADTQIMSTLISEGMEGYNKISMAMSEQASLNQKVNSQLTSNKNKWDAVKGTMENTAASMGSKLAPETKNFYDYLNNKAIPALQGFIDRHPKLSKWIFYIAIGFSALALLGGYLALAFAGISRGFGVLTTLFSGGFKIIRLLTPILWGLGRAFIVTVIPAIWGAVTATWAWTTALLANPVTWIVLGIVAVVALLTFAVYKLIKNWDKVKTFFANMWTRVKQIFANAWEGLKKMFLKYTPHGLIIQHWDKISAMFGKIWDKVKEKFSQAWEWIKGMGKQFWDAGKNIVSSIWNGIKSMADKPVQAIKDIVKKIRDHLPFSPAKVGPLKDIHRIKLVETIAASIRPDSLMRAWNNTLTTFVQPMRMPSPVPASYGHSGGVTFNYNPTINISGTATEQDAKQLASMGMDWFKRMMKQYEFENRRVGFS